LSDDRRFATAYNAAEGKHHDRAVVNARTIGFWHKVYTGPKGGVRWGIQYSYITKTGWSGNNGVPTAVGVSPKAVDNMLFTSFRYYIP